MFASSSPVNVDQLAAGGVSNCDSQKRLLELPSVRADLVPSRDVLLLLGTEPSQSLVVRSVPMTLAVVAKIARTATAALQRVPAPFVKRLGVGKRRLRGTPAPTNATAGRPERARLR